MDTTVLKLPVIGMLMRKIAVARFTRTLGTLISSGVPILEGLDITAQDGWQRGRRAGASEGAQGRWKKANLTDPLKESDVFPGHGDADDRVGEQTGAMDAMLQKIADFYEEEVDAAVKDLLTALEPVMIVFLGVVVGGIVISMYLPLFSLIGKLSGSALDGGSTICPLSGLKSQSGYRESCPDYICLRNPYVRGGSGTSSTRNRMQQSLGIGVAGLADACPVY